MIIPIIIDDEAQTVTISMEGYKALIVSSNHTTEEIAGITDIRKLRYIYEKAKYDHKQAGKMENVSLFNETQVIASKVVHQMERIINEFSLHHGKTTPTRGQTT